MKANGKYCHKIEPTESSVVGKENMRTTIPAKKPMTEYINMLNTFPAESNARSTDVLFRYSSSSFFNALAPFRPHNALP